MALFFGKRKKGSKTGTFLVLLVVLGSVGMTLAACGENVQPGSTVEATVVPIGSNQAEVTLSVDGTSQPPVIVTTPVPPNVVVTALCEVAPTSSLTPTLTLTPGPMHTSPDGLQHIKDWESRELQPYNDGEHKGTDLFYNRTGRGMGNCTVGWGHFEPRRILRWQTE